MVKALEHQVRTTEAARQLEQERADAAWRAQQLAETAMRTELEALREWAKKGGGGGGGREESCSRAPGGTGGGAGGGALKMAESGAEGVENGRPLQQVLLESKAVAAPRSSTTGQRRALPPALSSSPLSRPSPPAAAMASEREHWVCGVCTLRNDLLLCVCAACDTPRVGTIRRRPPSPELDFDAVMGLDFDAIGGLLSHGGGNGGPHGDRPRVARVQHR